MQELAIRSTTRVSSKTEPALDVVAIDVQPFGIVVEIVGNDVHRNRNAVEILDIDDDGVDDVVQILDVDDELQGSCVLTHTPPHGDNAAFPFMRLAVITECW